jgi:lysophospholipase L1-like esterase
MPDVVFDFTQPDHVVELKDADRIAELIEKARTDFDGIETAAEGFATRAEEAAEEAVELSTAYAGQLVPVSASSRMQPLVTDGEYVVTWLDGPYLDALGVGPRLRAAIRAITGGSRTGALTQTSGETMARHRMAIGHLARAETRTIRWHYLLLGDSMIGRPALPQAIVDDFLAMGVPIVASGWLGFDLSPQLSDGVEQATSGRNDDLTIVDIQTQGGGDGGQYSPEGFRAIMPDGDADATSTIRWKGKRLSLYHRQSGAAFRHVTDGGAAQDVTTGLGSGPGKTLITAAEEGWHVTVITRPTPTDEREWYGSFAASDLPGLTVSKMGNGGATFAHILSAMDTEAARYILADIAPDLTQINLLGNDAIASGEGRAPVDVAADLVSMVALLREANPAAEAFLSVRPQNGVAGIEEGRAFADYVPDLFDACEAAGIDMINLIPMWPPQAAAPWLWLEDKRHLRDAGGGPQITAAAQRRAFWESH